jgi:hypothetical protein
MAIDREARFGVDVTLADRAHGLDAVTSCAADVRLR